jgi:hypothetical protein
MEKTCFIMSVYINDNYYDFKEAFESLLNQTISGIGIYIQEDGIVHSEIHNYLFNEREKGNITYLGLREDNKGADYSLNELIDKAKKDGYAYFARMDADDISMPDRIERQLDFMNKNPDIDVCGTYIKEFGDGIKYTKVVTYPLTHNAMLDFFKKRVPIAHVSAFFRRRYFEKSGLYKVKGHFNNGDTLMWMDGFASGCRFANIGYIGVKVRVSQDFFGRRGGWKKTASDFKNRLTVNKKLNFGLSAYFYAVAVASVNMMPPTLKKYAYKYLRQ